MTVQQALSIEREKSRERLMDIERQRDDASSHVTVVKAEYESLRRNYESAQDQLRVYEADRENLDATYARQQDILREDLRKGFLCIYFSDWML